MTLGSSFPRLVEIMQRLLAPDGCAWDREQTLTTLRPFLIEEAYEVLEAMDLGDVPLHQEELGDLLMQIVFQSALRQAEGAFSVDDVIGGICDKLVRRHPHVFANNPGGIDTADSRTVLAQWEAIKQEEKANAKRKAQGALAGVPAQLPALARAQKLSHKAAKVGFDWPTWEGSMAKIEEETREVKDAIAAKHQPHTHHEIGDLLFAVVNLARKLEIDAEQALRDASTRFETRFSYVEQGLQARGKTPATSTLAEMDELWDLAKQHAAAADRR